MWGGLPGLSVSLFRGNRCVGKHWCSHEVFILCQLLGSRPPSHGLISFFPQTHLAAELPEAEVWSDCVACSQGQFESGLLGLGFGSQRGKPHVHVLSSVSLPCPCLLQTYRDSGHRLVSWIHNAFITWTLHSKEQPV